jgi:hypothetical protein
MVDVLRVFLTVTEGKKWQGNRTLHLEFEKALEDQGLKGVGTRRDQGGGGGRTYAAWLFSFGLWFADESHGLVHPTFAGEDLLKGVDPVPVLTAQILNFQYPSPFSKITRVANRFRIFPFRFLLKLLMDSTLDGYLTEKEIAGFVITRGETESDLAGVVKLITDFRKKGSNDSCFDSAFQSAFGTLTKLRDTANTFVNQLEFTQLIVRQDESRVSIAVGREKGIQDLLKTLPALISRTDEFEFFQRKYGLGPNHQRDNRTFSLTSSVSAGDAEKAKILLVLWDILAREPIKSIDTAVLNRISLKTGINASKIESIITAIGVTPSYDGFETKYLQLSMGGTAFAKEFEQATEGVFGSAGLGFETEWIGASPNNPDILAISMDPGGKFLGILDAKAYKEYTIIGDHRRRMSFGYIPKYQTYNHKGANVGLAFYSYVAGGFGSTVDSGIKKIFDETGTKGTAITAQQLLRLLRKHRSSPIPKSELKDLFTLNRQILPSDFTP